VGLGFTNGYLDDFEPEAFDLPLDAILNDNGVVWPHQPAHGVAGHAQVVLHADFGSVFHLLGAAAHHSGQAGRGHGAGHAHLALAAHLGARLMDALSL
jgi:hypothetical protein